MIGHVQTNKVKYMASFVNTIHSVDSYKLLKEIQKQAFKNNRKIKGLIQIRIANEETKFGIEPSDLSDFLNFSKTLPNIKIAGLMGMASFTNDKNQIRNEFRILSNLYNDFSNLEVLSMGMSGDYEIAVEEGSTMIRIGSKISLEREISKMYAIIDIESTGGDYDEEGITEIAIFQYDGYRITDQFCSLINLKKQIQPFVKKLTGINEKMLRNAPVFFEVAKRIVEITENCVIVAHNAAFDYRILKTEFKRLGYAYERKTICTINLSKELLPNQKVFNLGKLASNLGIPFSERHRAFGDAQTTLKLFELLVEKDIGKNIIREHTKILTNNKTPKRHLKIIDKLPSKMGIYYVLNSDNDIIYIGKSKNIKQSVIQDLTSSNKKSLIIQNKISKVTFSLTGGELITHLKQQKMK